MSVQMAKYGRFQKKHKADGSDRQKGDMAMRNQKINSNFFDGRSYKEVLLPSTNRIQNKTNMGRKTSVQQEKDDEGEKKEDESIVIYGEVSTDRKVEISKSVMGVTIQPVDFKELSVNLRKDWHTIVDIKPMGTFKTLVTFESPEEMEVAFKLDYLLNNFCEVRKWSVEEYS